MDDPSAGTSSSWLREPVLHFAVLAALLFVLDYFARQAQKEQIVVSRETAEFLIQQREDLELRELSPEERRETIDSFVEDEILYNEAYKRGLDRGDSRMRRNMILKMRGLLGGEVGEPTDEELREWYEQNRERFVRPPTLSLEQVFFGDPQAIPAGLPESLNAGLDPSTIGEDRFETPRNLVQVFQRELVGRFGPDAAGAILALDDDRWHGSFESPLGIHFVRVTGREPAMDPPYERVKPYLAGEWTLAQTRARIEREVESLRDDYEIVIEGGIVVEGKGAAE